MQPSFPKEDDSNTEYERKEAKIKYANGEKFVIEKNVPAYDYWRESTQDNLDS